MIRSWKMGRKKEKGEGRGEYIDRELERVIFSFISLHKSNIHHSIHTYLRSSLPPFKTPIE